MGYERTYGTSRSWKHLTEPREIASLPSSDEGKKLFSYNSIFYIVVSIIVITSIFSSSPQCPRKLLPFTRIEFALTMLLLSCFCRVNCELRHPNRLKTEFLSIYFVFLCFHTRDTLLLLLGAAGADWLPRWMMGDNRQSTEMTKA